MTEDPCRETCTRVWTARGLWLLFPIFLFGQALALAQSGPRPPCGMEPDPPYSGLDNPPIVKFWDASDLGRSWRPPACTGWAENGYSTLIATGARFRYMSGADGLLRHAGAISELAGMRYWSTTHKQWQTLISSAHALTDTQPTRQREDFAPDELRDGSVHFYEQVDNMSGTAVYQIHVAEVSADRLVFEVQNVSVMSRFFVTLFHPGDVQSIYYLDRESDGVWRYYSLVRTGRNASWLATGHPSSSINRAVAFYRSFVGIPTDREPPAAR
jgi:hypothetical protein